MSAATFVRVLVLSGGERFRCDLARALLGKGLGDRSQGTGKKKQLDPSSLIVFDEFTSVVDRTVAKIGSAAVSKAIRRMATTHRDPLTPDPCPLICSISVFLNS